MKPIVERLKAGEILVGDGAMGTLLLERGLQMGQCPENFNLERPEVLEEIAHLYVEAGSHLVETNTFGGSPLKLAEYGLDSRTEEINEIGISLVKKIAEGKAYVAASVGPTGKILTPYGDAEPEAVLEGYKRQIGAQIKAGADCLCIETMTDLREATLAIQAAREVSATIPILATMTFEQTKRGFYTIMGVNVEQAAKGLQEAGANVVGSNCGWGIEKMVEIATAYKTVTDLPILIQANAGQPVMKNGAVSYPETPEFFAEKAKQLIEAGVSIIGGCCGTTPEHIRVLLTQIAKG